jgi:hypothetical protein
LSKRIQTTAFCKHADGVAMEQTRHRETACINQQPQELAKLIRKLRWIDLEDEAQHLQLAMCSLPPQMHGIN